MSVTTAAGTRIAISANTPATFDSTGYGGSNVIFTNIGEIVNGGEHGREFALVTHMPIGSRGVQKFKGSFNAGQKTLQLGYDSDDAGQIIAKQAAASDNNYSFRVTYPSGDIDYFQAKVMSFKKQTDSVDSIVAATMVLELTSNSDGVDIVEVLV